MGRQILPLALGASFGFGLAVWTGAIDGAPVKFIRGDANADGALDISDPVNTLGFLFLGEEPPGCLDAADANDDGVVDISDASYSLAYQFLSEGPPPAPFPGCGTDPTDADGLGCASFDFCDQGPIPPEELRQIGHLLNRIAYGPTLKDIERIAGMGISAYIEEQLKPGDIDESGNTALNSRLAALTQQRVPVHDLRLVPRNSAWRYFKGTQQPPAAWNQPGFDDAAWLQGVTSIGYGDGDDSTVLGDMQQRADDPNTPNVNEAQPGYLSVYLRTAFTVADPAAIKSLILNIDYDDGFVAYLNGAEVARAGLNGNPPPYNVTASPHEAGTFVEFNITARKGLLAAGANVLAVQVHNQLITSGDLTINPELINREALPLPPITEYPDIDAVKASVHVRGIYSQRQLQVVLGDFWENHFTTDYDKVAEYFDNLLNSDATDAMPASQARLEAANLEAGEYEFFLENALGNFGDLLLHSATSPTMLIYLDNVLNRKGEANENYAREILELHTFGVLNGPGDPALGFTSSYTQRDIEQLAKCFTGWTICKVAPELAKSFPLSATSPPAECGVQIAESIFLPLGAGWKYFKGTVEPTPDAGGRATTAWTAPGFNDASWLNGSTGIGYGDNDDATVLNDMSSTDPSSGYLSVYLRRKINVADPAAFKNLIFEVFYDDGYVAYLNGVEIGRSQSMADAASPPPFNATSGEHEVTAGADYINLNSFISLLKPGENVLAIQVHNTARSSSDLSMRPRLIDRTILGGIENGDPNGIWTFYFDSSQHDTSSKSLLTGPTINIPANLTGTNGLTQEAIRIINDLVGRRATAEYVCTKLIQKFVSDTVPPALLADCIATWNSTNPRGNIGEIMRTILASEEFWAEEAYRAKVKTPLEFINSTVRALEGSTDGRSLVGPLDRMGMFIFTRDEPDGWSETGGDWIDTNGFLNRVKFAQDLTTGSSSALMWNTLPYLNANALQTAEDIVDFFNDVLYQGTLKPEEEQMIIEFLSTDNNYAPLPFLRSRSDFEVRADKGVSLMLSLPQWNFQ